MREAGKKSSDSLIVSTAKSSDQSKSHWSQGYAAVQLDAGHSGTDLRGALGDMQLTAVGGDHHRGRLLVHRVERRKLLDVVALDYLQPA